MLCRSCIWINLPILSYFVIPFTWISRRNLFSSLLDMKQIAWVTGLIAIEQVSSVLIVKLLIINEYSGIEIDGWKILSSEFYTKFFLLRKYSSKNKMRYSYTHITNDLINVSVVWSFHSFNRIAVLNNWSEWTNK